MDFDSDTEALVLQHEQEILVISETWAGKKG